MIRTLRLRVDPTDLQGESSQQSIRRAAGILRQGGTVAFPTETVYGLGANALESEAVAKIFEAKGRPSWDPLIAHVADESLLERVAATVPENARLLMDVFWPGPLTILLPRASTLPLAVTAGLEKVGVRMPAHPVAQSLLQAAGVPVAAPSANRFGRTSPTLAEHVAEDLDGRIDAILDAGETTHGVESTVLEVGDDACVIYRPGVITAEKIAAVCRVPVYAHHEQKEDGAEGAVSPGTGLRHYAPRARLLLIEGEGEAQRAAFAEAARRCEESGETVGLMLPDEFRKCVVGREAKAFRWGVWQDEEELAQRLYAGLRWLDAVGVTAIVCPVPTGTGIGVAIRDRLKRAAKR